MYIVGSGSLQERFRERQEPNVPFNGKGGSFEQPAMERKVKPAKKVAPAKRAKSGVEKKIAKPGPKRKRATKPRKDLSESGSEGEKQFVTPPPMQPTAKQREKFAKLSIRSQQFFVSRIVQDCGGKVISRVPTSKQSQAELLIDQFGERFEKAIATLRVPPGRKNVKYETMTGAMIDSETEEMQRLAAEDLHKRVLDEEEELFEGRRGLETFRQDVRSAEQRHTQLHKRRLHPALASLEPQSEVDTIHAQLVEEVEKPALFAALSRFCDADDRVRTLLANLQKFTDALGCPEAEDDGTWM